MVDKQQDFLTLTGAARRARSEGYDITYHSLRNLVAAGYISHVPNGSRINGIPFVPQKLRNFPAILEHRKIQTNPL